MADEKLNQSEIDALIAKMTGNPIAEEKVTFESLGLSSSDVSKIEKLFKASIESSAEVLGLVTQKDVTIDYISNASIGGKNEISKKIEPPFLATKVEYIEGLRGLDILLIKEEDMKDVVKIQFEQFGEDILDTDPEMVVSAANELMNQMMGNNTNKLGYELGISIDISTPESINVASDSEMDQIPFLKPSPQKYVYTTFKLNICGKQTGELIKVLELDFLDELMEIMKKSNYSEEAQEELQAAAIEKIEVKKEETVEVNQYELPQLTFNNTENISPASVSRVDSVEVDVKVVLGGTKMPIRNILNMQKGSVVQLDRVAAEPLDLYVNNVLFGKGEAVVVKENFGFRLLSVLDPSECRA